MEWTLGYCKCVVGVEAYYKIRRSLAQRRKENLRNAAPNTVGSTSNSSTASASPRSAAIIWALVGSEAAVSRGMTAEASIAEDSPVESVDPEYFMFATAVNPSD